MIHLTDISFSYGEKPVLKNYSLSLPESGVFAITGPSGVGKTTLLCLLAGILRPQAGRIEGLSGLRVSMVFQEDRLLPWYTAYENVLYALPREHMQKEQTARDWLEKMELQQAMHQLPLALSGGMQRRVALARACAYGGDILLLDEPFKGMDESLRLRVGAHIKTAAPLIVLVTHDLEDAERMGAVRIPFDLE